MEEPNRAATIGVIMAVYKPYSGGSPAMAANATPCGKTMAALVSPASASAFSDARVTFGIQFKNGKIADELTCGSRKPNMATIGPEQVRSSHSPDRMTYRLPITKNQMSD